MRGSREGTGGPPPKNHKILSILAILVRIPCKTTKLPSQHLMLGHRRPASETPLQWHFAGGPMMARLKWYLNPLSPHQQKRSQSWTPYETTFWIRACIYKETHTVTVCITGTALIIVFLPQKNLHFGGICDRRFQSSHYLRSSLP